MLVLTRREGEGIVLDTADGPIFVHVVEIREGRARIGLDAPRYVQIERCELAARRAADRDRDAMAADRLAKSQG